MTLELVHAINFLLDDVGKGLGHIIGIVELGIKRIVRVIHISRV